MKPIIERILGNIVNIWTEQDLFFIVSLIIMFIFGIMMGIHISSRVAHIDILSLLLHIPRC